MKKIDNETFIGGICASIAIIAIIAEMAVNNFSAIAVAAGVKDIATTLVAVLVFIFAVKNLWPKKEKETYESVLFDEFGKLEKKYIPLFNRAEAVESDSIKTKNKLNRIIRYNLLTDFENLYRSTKTKDELVGIGKNAGTSTAKTMFIDFEQKNPKGCFFTINKSSFGKLLKSLSDEDLDKVRDGISSDFAATINTQFKDFCSSCRGKAGIEVKFLKETGLSTPEDARHLARLTEYVLMLYMIMFQPE